MGNIGLIFSILLSRFVTLLINIIHSLFGAVVLWLCYPLVVGTFPKLIKEGIVYSSISYQHAFAIVLVIITIVEIITDDSPVSVRKV